MKMKTFALLLGTTVIATSQADAACPTLSSVKLGLFLCPVVGSKIPMPQGFSAVTYNRTSSASGMEFCTNLFGAVSKGIDTYKGEIKDYPGRETAKTNGTLVCKYTLSEEWRKAASTNPSEFYLMATVTDPAPFGATVCPRLSYEDMTDALCHKSFTQQNVSWSLQSSGLESFLSVCKGLLGKSGSGQGQIKGEMVEDQFVPFTHTCEYTFHAAGFEQNVILNGILQFKALKLLNDAH